MHDDFIIKYDILSEVPHCFTTRRGGVSKGGQKSLNMSFSREPSRENVLENYRRVAEAMGFDYSKMTCGHQKHTDHILKITDDMAGIGVSKELPKHLYDFCYDAMITDVPGIVLCTFHADCVPVLLYDSKNNAVAAIHSGWRGTALKISEKTIYIMEKEYGTNPSDILAVIGPSIGIDHFETDSDVYEAFKEAFGAEFDTMAADEALIYKKGVKYHISVSGFVYNTLVKTGIKAENIYRDNRCTYEDSNMFFSHRRDKGNTGAMSAMISVRGDL